MQVEQKMEVIEGDVEKIVKPQLGKQTFELYKIEFIVDKEDLSNALFDVDHYSITPAIFYKVQEDLGSNDSSTQG